MRKKDFKKRFPDISSVLLIFWHCKILTQVLYLSIKHVSKNERKV